MTVHVRAPVPAFHVVDRTRLLDRLSEAVRDAPLTLVSAPAGSGKTVLTAAWARHYGQTPVAWLSSSGGEDTFLTDVQRALTDAGAGTTDSAAANLDQLSDELLRLDQPVVLVVDAAERVQRRTVFDQLDRLLDSSGDHLRVLMTTRVDPPMPLHRYRLEGTVAEIRQDDLAFTGAEVAALLGAHDVNEPEIAAKVVLDRTEGWAAGVRLAALAMRSGAQAGALNGFATDYLVAEVFGELDEADRDFLLRISPVDEFTPDLAASLSDRADAGAVLQRMTAGNTFVQPVRGRANWYRIHPLFREFLRAQVVRTLPVDDLHQRAADWYADQGQLLPAVRHAAATGDWERAASVVIRCLAIADLLLSTATGTALAEELASMPALDRTDVHLVRAALALKKDDVDTAADCLARCEMSLPAAVLTTVMHDKSGSVDATLVAARDAREQLPASDSDLLSALVLAAEGTAYLRRGDLDSACAVLGEAVRLATYESEDLRLRCVATLALAEACRGHLSRGEGLADMAERIADDSHRLAAAHLARAWVALERQDLHRAQHSLTRARNLSETQDDVLMGSVSTLLRARLMRDRGDTVGARSALRTPEPRAGWLREYVDAEAAGVGLDLLDRGESDQADRQTLTTSQRVQDLLDHAHSQWLDGDVRGGRSEIAKALSLARGERIRRPFTHLPARIRAVIRNDLSLRSHALWLRPDQTTAMTWARDPSPIVEELSERELEVLRRLSTLRSTDEIAAELFISVNTVKTHVRKILRKLSVSSRNEAVRRAWDLHLI
ncbi:LuxR C-terminal-related transcriptional regulator [Kribbella sp. NPDC054772]